jgi:hypothetical protein
MLIFGLALLVVRFSINWDKRKYSDYRKPVNLFSGIIFTIDSFIGFYMYFTDDLYMGITEMSLLILVYSVIALFFRLKYFKRGIYIGAKNAKK